MLIIRGFRVGDVTGIGIEKCRSMQDREQGGPFLEKDIDHLVGHEARRHLWCRRDFWKAFGGRASLPVRSEESLGLEVRAWLTAFLDFELEGIWEVQLWPGFWNPGTNQRKLDHSMHP